MEREIPQCKYFVHGSCSKGSKCLFAHDLKAKPDNTCKFYLAGNCSYGKACRYDHVRPARLPSPVQVGPTKSTNLEILANKPKEKTWLDAPAFVPGNKNHGNEDTSSQNQSAEASGPVSYVGAAITNLDIEPSEHIESNETYKDVLCPFAAVRECPYGERCEYLHGDICDMCGLECLHPTDKQQRKEHEKECMEYHEKEMKIAFAIQKSDDVACSICFDIVKSKSDITERMFGILENCSHPFCLSCVRKWRASNNQDKNVVRSCPICRKHSWFITPSEFWVDEEEEKKELINDYKSYLGTKHCRNYDRGKGTCSFGSSCFYKHEDEDGKDRKHDKPAIRYREGTDGETSISIFHRLAEFIERLEELEEELGI